MTGGVRKLTEDIWTVKLIKGCEMDYHTSIRAVALACPGVDYMRLWPLPVVQPWQRTSESARGRLAERSFIRCYVGGLLVNHRKSKVESTR
jgi:hypothetical protein